ncbi:NAD-dependent epimerase/dehydratase family protein [Fusobacterium ulcerans]|jgi:UDP-2-acetamido-2,6-beta-L-arabino-hexul-4-ose reductase|uniref:polysaccharide biosynthesis C-terminal domain-containing protein n=1 Tax=Fusobacterium ulcerans TaxID=861 RepID=UPI000E4FCA7F|nr:NAD-dependent epimerase/dehydratase family protein [Fusobacterium ulcerans]RGY63019.1 NAD-dependent epimerase/dehydratase family protein [Fusobacterium ulcerans]
MEVLVTGAKGFIGKNLVERLSRIDGIVIHQFDKENTIDEVEEYIGKIDFIFHLAGINRPENPEEFYKGNRDTIKELIEVIEKKGLEIPILVTSSIQAEKNNDYGKSKLEGEIFLREYSKRNYVQIYIYRLPNVFGKWCRPNYNSVIATWCHNIANNIDITISDRNVKLNFVYIDDVVNTFVSHLQKQEEIKKYYEIPTVYSKTLGEISDLIHSFKNNRKTLVIEKVGEEFERALYSTYLSYLPEDNFSYELTEHKDNRGAFVEILRTVDSGQFSISTSKPGITRGNHYHNTKNEKFLVIKGEAVIRFRNIYSDKVIEYPVSDKKLEVVDIPVGYTHNITNIGTGEMILVIWANELFDKENPDTYYLEV